jgi:hypothetical protein
MASEHNKLVGCYEGHDDPYPSCDFQQNRPKSLQEIRDRAKFYLINMGQKVRGFAGFWLIAPLNWVT